MKRAWYWEIIELILLIGMFPLIIFIGDCIGKVYSKIFKCKDR